MDNGKKKFHERNMKILGMDLNPFVSGISVVIIAAYIIYALVFSDVIVDQITTLQENLVISFKYIITYFVALLFILAIILVISKYGKIRIGGRNSSPHFKRFSWYSMLFSAGMGIGLVFFGVAEPLFHLNTTPIFQGGSELDSALATTYFHWGLQAWAIYGFASLLLAYYTFNRNLPLSPRSLLYPLLKDKIYGLFGDFIDAIVIVVTLFSLSSSLGLGAQQVNSGLNYLFNIPINQPIQFLIIIVVTLFATVSLVTGLKKGVRILSELNIVLAVVLLVSMFLLGPTGDIISSFFTSSAHYLKLDLFESFNVVTQDNEWLGSWTIFYWAWWIGWSIFVGLFIAKISFGRSIRDFLLSTILVPTGFTIIWFCIMGTNAYDVNLDTAGQLLNDVNENVAISLFAMIDYMFSSNFIIIALQLVSLVLIISFFVTSSDSGSMIVDTLASGGKLEHSNVQKVFWAAMEGALAIIFIFIGGSEALDVLQKLLLIASIPILIFLLVSIVIFLTQLNGEYKKQFNKK